MFPNDDRLLDLAPHDPICRLLPWYINGSLAGAERERVRAHLEGCPLCREEAAALMEFSARLAQCPLPKLSAQASFARLQARLEKPRPTLIDRFRWAWQGTPAYRLAIALALALTVVPTAWQEWKNLTEPRFHTLADPVSAEPAVAGDLRIVFDPTIGPERVEALLRSVDGAPLRGPDAAGVATIRLADGGQARVAAAIARLRGQDGVLLVEPVNRP